MHIAVDNIIEHKIHISSFQDPAMNFVTLYPTHIQFDYLKDAIIMGLTTLIKDIAFHLLALVQTHIDVVIVVYRPPQGKYMLTVGAFSFQYFW